MEAIMAYGYQTLAYEYPQHPYEYLEGLKFARHTSIPL